jgi:hypothetical protein
MKTLMSVMLGVFAVSAMSAQAEQYKFVGTDQSFETKLCVAVTQDDVKELKMLLQAKGERLHVVRSAVRCNEMPIADFAEQYGFIQVARYLGADKKDTVFAALTE